MSLNLNLRGDLGRKLSISELDTNFSNIQDAINNGNSKTFQLKAHSSLTTDDIGKFVISYTDPSWNDYIIGGGTPSSFTASLSEARLPFLAGTTSGVNGKWTIDFAATYNSQTWTDLSTSDSFIYISTDNSIPVYKRNLQFQSEDPYLSPIINSLTYSLDNNGHGNGTYSVTTNPNSLAILFEYYVNNGIPYRSDIFNNNYTADGSNGDTEPYFITQTFSTPFVSATRSGTSVQLEISKDIENFYGGMYYYSNNNFNDQISPDVPLQPENSIPYLTYAVVGILENLEGGTASISQVPEIIELSPTTGIYDTNQEEFTNLIVSFNSPLTAQDNVLLQNYWYVSGGNDLINYLYYYNTNLPASSMYINSPTYKAITSGVVGDKITFVKTSPIFGGQ
jgi:hypothetical protein